MKIFYLGPTDTFSEKAAQLLASKVDGEPELTPLASIGAVAKSVTAAEQGNNHFAVVPYYNYLEGLVQECVDLVYENNLFMIGAQRVPIAFCIGMHPNNKDFTKIYSHSKALAQCSDYIWEHFPDSLELPVSSTSEGSNLVTKNQSGLAISSKAALGRNNLKIIAEDIGNKRHGRSNFTDFYLLSKVPVEHYDPQFDYLTMIAVTPHLDRAGLLAEILGQIAYHGLNNAKIHSRPAIDEVTMDVEPQMFYLEIMCHKSNPDFKRCIDSLRYRLTPKGKDVEVVRVLGSYRRPLLLPAL